MWPVYIYSSSFPSQIFPVSEDECEVLQGPSVQRGRLPSIVVDPTQVSEEEIGGLLWPLQRHASSEEDEDSIQEQSEALNNKSDQEEQGNTEGSGEERSVQSIAQHAVSSQ